MTVAEVVQPPGHIPSQFCDSEGHAPTTTAPGDFPDPLLESGHGTVSPAQFSAKQKKTQKRALAQFGSLALRPIDDESEPPFYESTHRGEHTFSGPLAPGENQEVGGVARKAEAAPVEFPVQVIEHDVGKQR